MEPKHIKKPSNGELRKAGDSIREFSKENKFTNETSEAIKTLTLWRSLHVLPLQKIHLFIRMHLKRNFKNKKVIIGQRLKRMPSILGKIKRFETMAVDRIQDIGGIRIILPTIDDVYTVYESLIHTRAKHDITTKLNDYIKTPKKDGYRSLHQVFKYHGQSPSIYDNMKIEVQIRTIIQHAWATAVEILGEINKTSYKTGEGGELEKRFFKIASALFSIEEHTEILDDFKDWNKQQLIEELKKIDDNINIIAKLNGASVTFNKIDKTIKKSYQYYILVLTVSQETKGSLRLTPFNNEDDAKDFYAMREEQFREDASSSVLMIHSDSMREIEKAYPNYFLDTQLFISKLKSYLNYF